MNSNSGTPPGPVLSTDGHALPSRLKNSTFDVSPSRTLRYEIEGCLQPICPKTHREAFIHSLITISSGLLDQ
ncbi:hypothetical protein TNCV_2115851 [Trichonephila clavipes]|nr:hypothetical protein TNCV_2115851 [Trichonephila clavipes]